MVVIASSVRSFRHGLKSPSGSKLTFGGFTQKLRLNNVFKSFWYKRPAALFYANCYTNYTDSSGLAHTPFYVMSNLSPPILMDNFYRFTMTNL